MSWARELVFCAAARDLAIGAAVGLAAVLVVFALGVYAGATVACMA